MTAATPTQPTGSNEERRPLEPDLGLACDFALRWAPETFPFITIASILPGGAPRARTWHAQQDQPHLRRWLASRSGRENLYFTVNAPAKETLKGKPKKTDIGLLGAVWGDLDPHPDVEAEPGGWQAERDRLLALAAELAALPWPPTVLIDSGNGIAPLWQLEAVLPNVQENQQATEALGRRIEKALGGIENTSNVDRLLRLPGTINLPDAKKLEKGRGPVLSGIVSATWHRHSWRDLEALADHLEQQPLAAARIYKRKPNGKGNCQANESAPTAFDLPEDPPDALDDASLEALRAAHPNAFDLARYDGDQSRQDLALASLARRAGWAPVDAWRLIIAVRGDRKATRRDYVERTLRKAYAEQADTDHAAPDAKGDALFDLSHDGLALDMGRRWQREARHVALWGKWMFWGGARWEPDEKLAHLTRTRNYLRARADSLVRAAAQGEIEDFDVDQAEVLAKQLRSAPMVANVVGLARSNEELIATVDQWDADPFLLGTPDGTVDLRTGRLRPARQADFITKCTVVAPAPAGTTAPIWQAFLERIFRHDPELAAFIQRAIGYSLCGQVSAHVLLFCWGQGGNGKGVLLNTVSRVLGDYAAVAPSDLLLVTQSDRHPCDMAMLRGARMVTAQELAPGRAWDEPKLKSLTGGDPITARFMRQDFFTYEPQFTLWVAGNHKPAFKGVDEAIRRRVLLVPFLQVIPEAERDEHLAQKLKAEWPAILRWAIDGCLAWQREGLAPPESARAATKDYLDAEDLLGQWLEERCNVSPKTGWTALKRLYDNWRTWAEPRGLHPGASQTLGKRLDERGFTRHRTNQGPGFYGIELLPTSDESDDCDDFPHIARNDPLGARARTDYARYGADRHNRHSEAAADPDEPSDRIRGEL